MDNYRLYDDSEWSTDIEDLTLTSCESGSEELSEITKFLNKAKNPTDSSNEYDIPRDFNDDREGFLKFPYKPNHVLLIYRNLQVGLCTDMEVVFPDATFKCHRWIVDAYMGTESLKLQPTTKEKFVTEYYCCLKAPELPMLLRAYYRNSDTQDFIVYIGHEAFKCHYDVVRCYTDFFDHKKRFETVTLPKPEVSIRAFFMIYRGWMLDQIPKLPIRGILEVFRAAKYLRIDFLVKAIVKALKEFEKENWKDENHFSIYEPPKLLNKFYIEKFPGVTEN